MDPKKDPDFVPPSDKEPFPLPTSTDKIPKNDPIQPYVLADYPNSLDAPISSRERRHSHHLRHNNTAANKHKPSELSTAESASPAAPASFVRAAASAVLNQHQSAIASPDLSIKSTIPRIQSEFQKEGSSSSSSSSISSDTEDIGLVDSRGQQPPSLMLNSNASSSKLAADLEEVPHGITRQAKVLSDYIFPTHRLKRQLHDNSKFPLVIVACGSFSPITYLHLRMFEMALDDIQENTRFEVVGGYYSPVSDHYNKSGLAPSHHRVRMCELACERTSNWLMVDAWESLQPTYTRTALVLDHFNEEINVKRGGILSADGKSKRGVKIMLLAGGDLIVSMGEPNVWADNDLHHILGSYGCLIVERTGSDVRNFLLSHDILYEHRKNILVIKQLIYNDISSTKVRLFIRRCMSVQYLLPNSVIRYIQEYKLYYNTSEPVKQVLDNND